jgi:hypothetical protein
MVGRSYFRRLKELKPTRKDIRDFMFLYSYEQPRQEEGVGGMGLGLGTKVPENLDSLISSTRQKMKFMS